MSNQIHLWVVTTRDYHVLFLGQPLSDLVSIITVFGLFLTIYLSLRALRETAHANALSGLPILTLRHYASEHSRHQLVVENIGNGTALNIRVDSFYQSFVDDFFHPRKANHYVLISKPVDVLKASAHQALDTSTSIVGGFINVELMVFKIFNSQKPLDFYVRFQDIGGAEFISKVRISVSGVKVAGRPKRYTFTRRAFYYLYRLTERLHLVLNRHNANKQQLQENQRHKSSINATEERNTNDPNSRL